MDANTRIVQGLGKLVDDSIAWLSAWHQVAFYAGEDRAQRAAGLVAPASFPAWVESARAALPAQQGILDRLEKLHDGLHMAARMVLLKTPEGEALAIADYEKVISGFDEFITAVRRLERAFSEAAAGLDPLTGLRTRNGLTEDFTREVNRFRNAGTPFVLAVVDIDHFKPINATHGHETGDKALISMANLLLRHIRTYDDAYRLGGEEFLLVLKGLDETAAVPVLERLRASVARNEMKSSTTGGPLRFTASFGFVGHAQGRTLEEELALADQALYRAKRDGRDRVVKAA